MSDRMLGIAFYQGVPKLIEIVAITGKRAKIRRPNAPSTGEVKSLPVTEIYEYNEEVWGLMETSVNRIEKNKRSIEEQRRSLRLLIESLKAKAGGVDDDFWS